jgi:glycine C-acetyltransferase
VHAAEREAIPLRSPSPTDNISHVSRKAHRLLFDQGVLAFMVEFPVTPTGSSRFRLQVQAGHQPEEAREAARIIDRSITEARAYLSTAFGSDLA